MYQAIQTRYFGPTNFRGSRVKATCAARSVTVPWDHALNPEQNHNAACAVLLARMGWTGRTFVGGSSPDGKGYVYVDTHENSPRVTVQG